MTKEPATMVTQEGGSPVGGTIGKSPIERDMSMAEAGEASSIAGEGTGKATRITFMAMSEQWERNMNEKRLRSEILMSSSAPGDRRSRLETTMMQLAREIAQLHQMVNKIATLLEGHAVCEKTQWLGMRMWMEARERMWDIRLKDDMRWGQVSQIWLQRF
jgi:hypothetical protein